MSMCNMPLLIKVKMTRENYEKLLEEAKTKYKQSYLEKYYLFDEEYFSLDTDYMDDLDIYKEAEMIAKYIESTEKQVGLIFAHGCSYTVGDLYFKNGIHIIENIFEPKCDSKGFANIEEAKQNYITRKKEFLNSF